MGTNVERDDEGSSSLPAHYRKVHAAVWLIGIAILAWQDWWWPGILVLVAISGLIEAGLQVQAKRAAQTEAVQQARVRNLPAHCPSCGGPLSANAVTWLNDLTAQCPYCKASIRVQEVAASGPAKP